MYAIKFLPGAFHYFKKIREKGLKGAYKAALVRLRQNPRLGEMKSGDLAGVFCYDVYYKGTNYEIAYRIYEKEGKLIVVILAGTRENFYQQLKRYMK